MIVRRRRGGGVAGRRVRARGTRGRRVGRRRPVRVHPGLTGRLPDALPDAQKSLAHQGEACADALAALDLPHGRARDAAVWSDRAQAGTYECAPES